MSGDDFRSVDIIGHTGAVLRLEFPVFYGYHGYGIRLQLKGLPVHGHRFHEFIVHPERIPGPHQAVGFHPPVHPLLPLPVPCNGKTVHGNTPGLGGRIISCGNGHCIRKHLAFGKLSRRKPVVQSPDSDRQRNKEQWEYICPEFLHSCRRIHHNASGSTKIRNNFIYKKKIVNLCPICS